MVASILSFASRILPKSMPWQNQDYAEFYRVRDRLNDSGFTVETDSGVSDEGEPWFIFQRAGSDDILVHVARIDRELVVVNGMTGQIFRGAEFREVIDQMLEDAPLVLPQRLQRNGKVVFHPSVVLTAFVAAAFLLADGAVGSRAEASPLNDGALDSDAADGAGQPGDDTAPAPPANGEAAARRAGKDGPQTAQPQAANSNTAFSLADMPGNTAAMALSATLFVAELLRLATQEGELAETSAGEPMIVLGAADDALGAPALEEAEAAVPVIVTVAELKPAEDGAAETHLHVALEDAAAAPKSSGSSTPSALSDAASMGEMQIDGLDAAGNLDPLGADFSSNVIEISTAIPAADAAPSLTTDLSEETTEILTDLFGADVLASLVVTEEGAGDVLLLSSAEDPDPLVAEDQDPVSSGSSPATSSVMATSSVTMSDSAADLAAPMPAPSMAAAPADPMPAQEPVIFASYQGWGALQSSSGPAIRTMVFADGVQESLAFTAGHTVVEGFRLGEDRIELTEQLTFGRDVSVSIENGDIIMVEETGMAITLVGVLDTGLSDPALAA